jgi:DNA-binding XRE family transcriptional regulator
MRFYRGGGARLDGGRFLAYTCSWPMTLQNYRFVNSTRLNDLAWFLRAIKTMNCIKRTNSQQWSSISYGSNKMILQITLHSETSPKLRRVILLSTIKQLRPCIEKWKAFFIEHGDYPLYSPFMYENRGIHEPSAVDLHSEHGKIGAWVRVRRIQLGMTQRELAKRLGSTAASISKIERGIQNPKNKLRFALFKILNGELKPLHRAKHRALLATKILTG